MKKIMFNDFCQLTQAVLEGKKTQTRRICRIQPPYEYFDIAFPCYWIDEDNPKKDPLYGSFCWVNKITPQEHTDWIKPTYRVGEIVAVAQSYRNCGGFMEDGTPRWDYISQIVGSKIAGWNNKMLVKGELMPHQIRITNVRIQRLQDMSDEECLAEGIIKNATRYCFKEKVKQTTGDVLTFSVNFDTPRKAYAALIDKISGKGTWDSNPCVWAYTFELVK